MNHKLNTPQANVFTFSPKDVTFLHKMTRLIALQKPQTKLHNNWNLTFPEENGVILL